jgi:diguanylate cyclase (GGDEF)-like protein/PAS domain S-box-containing protein
MPYKPLDIGNHRDLAVVAGNTIGAGNAYQGSVEDKSLLNLAADCMSCCIVLTDSSKPDNPIVYVNSAFTVMTGYEPQDAIGKNLRILQGPETDAAAISDLGQALASGHSVRREVLNYRKNGEAFWNDVTIDPIRNSHDLLTGFAAIMYDSSVRHTEHAEKLAALGRLEAITSNAPGYVFQRVLKRDGSISYGYLSPSLFRILGLPEDTDWSGGQNFAWFQPDDREDFLRLTRQSAADMTTLSCDIRVLSAAGAELWFRTNSSPRRLENGDTVWEGLALDVTAEKLALAELEFVAHHDVLTKLPNRFFFKNAVSDALSRPVEATRGTALFHVDLCSFATINDIWGEARADKVLRRVALRLTELAETIAGTATRLGGDEFGLFVPDMPPQTNALDVGQLICAEISRPMVIDGSPIVVEACVGVAEFSLDMTEIPQGAQDRAAELMKRARLAISAAKREGVSSCVLYSPAIVDGAMHSVTLRNSLRQAIESEHFELHYQPLVDLDSGSIIGAEALVRWSHPDLGLVRPDIFIPIAEATRLIVPLGAWITKAVMRQTQSWKRAGISVPPISINLSSVQLQSASFLDMVEDALTETGCNGADFEFELTEGVLIEISPEVSARLAGLKALGFTLALDDFGSGHATFAYLRRLPVNKIKIDQIFVRQLIAGSSDALIIKAMIGMARSLGIDVIAEGIETRRQRDFLIEEGCQSGQGYFFSLPLKPEDFAWMLEQGVSLPVSGTALTEHEGG